MAQDDLDLMQFLDLFVDESREYLQQLNSGLLSLERSPEDPEIIATIFRAAHSLKGMSATMGFAELSNLAHAAEDLLHKVRDGEWALNASLLEILFSTVDAMGQLVNAAASEKVSAMDTASILSQLHSYEPPPQRSEQSKSSPSTASEAVDEPAASEHSQDSVTSSAKLLSQQDTNTIRVAVQHLNKLLNVTTEMAIQRSLFAHLAARYELPALDDALEKHDQLLSQLQNTVLKVRMVPVEQVFRRFPRMVRDLLKEKGKKARLVIDSGEAELDRTALEAITDSIMHLLRNAIDHGLETPAEREAAGKSPVGTLRLSARQQQEGVFIELSDDGRGMDYKRIAEKAVERGLLTAQAVEELPQEELLQLVCYPGFSLSEEITATSGRGVGMDAVKRQVEELRGSLQITSEPGSGSTFSLQLPAMLSLVRVLLLEVQGEQYAIPSGQVERVLELAEIPIEAVGQEQVMHLGTEVLSLYRLDELLKLPPTERDSDLGLLIQNRNQRWGLQVDKLLGHEEVVIKPLPVVLQKTPGLAGVTILGEGKVVLILDVAGLLTPLPK